MTDASGSLQKNIPTLYTVRFKSVVPNRYELLSTINYYFKFTISSAQHVSYLVFTR